MVTAPERLGICFDTFCVFAAGYALSSLREYRATMQGFGQTVGLQRLKLFHVNDSVREQGSRVDRHAHIGRGRIGLEAFRYLVNDRRFHNRPMILETPKEDGDEADMNTVNLGVLRGLQGNADSTETT